MLFCQKETARKGNKTGKKKKTTRKPLKNTNENKHEKVAHLFFCVFPKHTHTHKHTPTHTLSLST